MRNLHKHCVNLIPAYIPTYVNVEANYLLQRWLLLEWHLLPYIAEVPFQLGGLPDMDLLASCFTTHCQHYYTLETSLPLGTLGLNAFNHPWTYQESYIFPPATLVLLVLSKFPAEHNTGQFRLLILVHHVGWRLLGFPQFSTC